MRRAAHARPADRGYGGDAAVRADCRSDSDPDAGGAATVAGSRHVQPAVVPPHAAGGPAVRGRTGADTDTDADADADARADSVAGAGPIDGRCARRAFDACARRDVPRSPTDTAAARVRDARPAVIADAGDRHVDRCAGPAHGVLRDAVIVGDAAIGLAPVAAPTAVAPVPTVTSGNGWIGWLALAGGLAALVAAVALRRRRASIATPDAPDAPDAVAPTAPDARVPPAAPSPPRAPAMLDPHAAAPRAWLTASLSPRRAGLNLLSATVEAELLVRNDGAAPASAIRVGAALVGAMAGPPGDVAALFAQPVVRPVVPPFALAPGEERRVRLVVARPRTEIQPLQAGGRAMFVPVVTVNLLYDAGGIEGQTAQAAAVGVERVDSPKLAPLWLDQPARMYEAIGARPYAAAITR